VRKFDFLDNYGIFGVRKEHRISMVVSFGLIKSLLSLDHLGRLYFFASTRKTWREQVLEAALPQNVRSLNLKSKILWQIKDFIKKMCYYFTYQFCCLCLLRSF